MTRFPLRFLAVALVLTLFAVGPMSCRSCNGEESTGPEEPSASNTPTSYDDPEPEPELEPEPRRRARTEPAAPPRARAKRPQPVAIAEIDCGMICAKQLACGDLDEDGATTCASACQKLQGEAADNRRIDMVPERAQATCLQLDCGTPERAECLKAVASSLSK